MTRLINPARTRGKGLAVTLLCLIILASCSSEFARAVRQVTYPPDFIYVSEEELSTNMRRLGSQLAQLDDALVESESRQPIQQEVVSILTRIEQIGSSMQSRDAGTSHDFLEEEMPSFVNEVARARLAAMADPPQYYLAGRVAGACLNCHRTNRDKR